MSDYIAHSVAPVAGCPVHHHEGDEDAEEEQDEHGVLDELDVVRVVKSLCSEGIQSDQSIITIIGGRLFTGSISGSRIALRLKIRLDPEPGLES